ncbi:NAD(P)/FAD-dependent oxidoreductase [Cytobacillus purgationiresistens]|uniref:Sarcosine oxidase subunit alpha n=1 Tax=Cytobacillus purgationiresistens TaxID=863449 RepID=A0ABU0AEY4_9BACI|nr:NAD(P)/FAD-dependent oxidoreductase [Cytobacillus purgationiresistens]MDQ0269813.1 sarcosine oxidase subunit alpha [Cytobacillus purgationiresistens]
MDTDVLIIGAGPAGIVAAIETASKGLNVTIIDESNLLGGQLRQQTQMLQSLPSPYQSMRGFELAQDLTNQLTQFPIRYLLEHRIIGIYANGSLGITDELNVFPIMAKKIIVATGATENAISFPKWTLPGIMTIGAAQTLVNRDFVIPGKSAVIVGSTDFAMDIIHQLIDVGINIKGIIEQQPTIQAREMKKVNELYDIGLPFYVNASIKEARGIGEVKEVDIQLQDRVFTEYVDLVLVDGGRSPILDLFYQLNCSFGFGDKLGGWVPSYNQSFQTSVNDVFIAGNATGISVHGALLITGKIAATSVCEELEVLSREEAEKQSAELWKELESREYTDVFQERIKHIESYKSPMLKNQFIS